MSVTWKPPQYRFVSLVEFGEECSHRNIEFVCPATEQFVILTVHSQTADRVLDRQVDQPGYHFFTVLNAPTEIDSWESLIAVLPQWRIVELQKQNSGREYVFTTYIMAEALNEQMPIAYFQVYKYRPVSWRYIENPPFCDPLNGHWQGDRMFGSKFEELAYSDPWPVWMHSLSPTRPEDWYHVHVQLYAFVVKGKIVNAGSMDSVWMVAHAPPVNRVEVDGPICRAYKVECRKFYRRRNPDQCCVVVTPRRQELEAIVFRSPNSPLWQQFSELYNLRKYLTRAMVQRPQHTMRYTELYRQFRREGMPNGLAKRQALQQRQDADRAIPQWQAYLQYLEEPETFLAQLEEEIAIASAQAEADNARLIAEAQVQWQKEVEAFRKKWVS